MSDSTQKRSTPRTVAVLGYGSQGQAVALNLRDSGWDIVVGLRPDSASIEKARKDGINHVVTIEEAMAIADIICFALPDHGHRPVYEKSIAPHLKKQACLWFLHGLSVHFKLLKPPVDTDVILLAPHAPGQVVREKYLSGERDLSAFFATHQDRSGRASDTILALAEGLGFSQDRLIETDFETETLGDLFGEQAVLCGGLTALLKNGFEVLVEKGIPPDNAWLEVGFQLDLIVGLIKTYGIEGMYQRISLAARYGSLLTGPRIIDRSTKERMSQVFDEIKSGKFVQMLDGLSQSDLSRIEREIKNLTNPSLEESARKFAGQDRSSTLPEKK